MSFISEGGFCAVQTDCHSPSNENLKCIKQKCTDIGNNTTSKFYKDVAIQTQFDSISPQKEVIFGPDYSSLGSPTTTRDESTQFFGDSCREEGLQCAGVYICSVFGILLRIKAKNCRIEFLQDLIFK